LRKNNNQKERKKKTLRSFALFRPYTTLLKLTKKIIQEGAATFSSSSLVVDFFSLSLFVLVTKRIASMFSVPCYSRNHHQYKVIFIYIYNKSLARAKPTQKSRPFSSLLSRYF
jgi:hypothetical protein